MKPKLENNERSKWECLWAITPFATLLLSGCGHSDSGAPSTPLSASGSSGGVLAAMRPRASEALIEKIRQQEATNNQPMGISSPAQSGSSGSPFTGMNGLGGRVLPKVITDPIAPPAEEAQADAVVSSEPDQSSNVQPVNTTTTNNTAMSYGTNYTNPTPAPPPGALSGGALVPPPPAVTLSTQAQPVTAMAGDPNNPYGAGGYPYPGGGYPNPYANPYMNPYAMPYPPQQAVAPPPPQRPSGLFGSSTGHSSASSDDSDSAPAKKRNQNFVPITPTGMESRSPYKQRDDLKILWKGVLSSSSLLGTMASDGKILEQLGKLEVGLPADATKGSFSLSQRQVDAVFKASVPGVDRRVVGQVRKLESNLIQSYYRYLYTYNKFSLAQQTVGARKQEAEVADTQSEQQRATADLSQAQSELDSAKEDMKSSQIELAQSSSAAAARAVISKVSGVAPALEALKAPEDNNSSESSKHFGFPNFSLFHGKSNNDKKEAEASSESGSEESTDADKGSKKDQKKEKSAKEKSSKDKDSKDKDAKDKSVKGKKLKVVASDKESDLAPAPSGDQSESSSKKEIASRSGSSSSGSLASLGIAFNLKEVAISARKSVLTVTIHNGGSEAFNFNSDSISVSEGNRKLPDAATRSEFDSTLIQPDQDVKGTITIFGRPWNEKLSVSLTQEGKSIQLKR